MNLKPRLLVVALFCAGSLVTSSMAQTVSTPANPQNPSTQSLQAGVDVARFPVESTISGTTPSLTAIQGVASIASSSRPGSLRSAGRGLPGMPGRPPHQRVDRIPGSCLPIHAPSDSRPPAVRSRGRSFVRLMRGRFPRESTRQSARMPARHTRQAWRKLFWRNSAQWK
jgi:hypothetical protein